RSLWLVLVPAREGGLVIATDDLARALVAYLPRQRWFGGDAADAELLEIESTDVLRDEWPALVQVLVRVPSHGVPSMYNVLDGPNPDVEMTSALASAGFGAVARPVGQWLASGRHLAVVTEFLSDGVDGFQLALTSLRDLYDCKCEPWEAGGDFGPDAHRLGAI